MRNVARRIFTRKSRGVQTQRNHRVLNSNHSLHLFGWWNTNHRNYDRQSKLDSLHTLSPYISSLQPFRISLHTYRHCAPLPKHSPNHSLRPRKVMVHARTTKGANARNRKNATEKKTSSFIFQIKRPKH